MQRTAKSDFLSGFDVPEGDDSSCETGLGTLEVYAVLKKMILVLVGVFVRRYTYFGLQAWLILYRILCVSDQDALKK